MKTYIIDALNLVHKSPSLRGLVSQSKEKAISGLANEISIFFARYQSYKAVLVVDGTITAINKFSKNITIIESQNNTADDKIKEIINKSQKKSDFVVVSSDTEVYNFAKMNVVDVMISEDFLKLINSNKSQLSNKSNKTDSNRNNSGKPSGVSKKEIREFKELFGTGTEV